MPSVDGHFSFFTDSIARSVMRRYLIYSEADFEVFAPQGRHVAPIGGEIWLGGASSAPKFTPIGATVRV